MDPFEGRGNRLHFRAPAPGDRPCARPSWGGPFRLIATLGVIFSGIMGECPVMFREMPPTLMAALLTLVPIDT